MAPVTVACGKSGTRHVGLLVKLLGNLGTGDGTGVQVPSTFNFALGTPPPRDEKQQENGRLSNDEVRLD